MATTRSIADLPHLTQARSLRRSARNLRVGDCVPEAYRGDRRKVLRLLNDVLATQLVRVLTYRQHHFMAFSRAATRIAEEFLAYADEELSHADLIATRIVQLGGEPNLSPEALKIRSRAEYPEATSIVAMITEDIAAAQTGMEGYRKLIAYLAEDDPTTRRMLEGILGVLEEHADELVTLLEHHV